MFLISCLLVFTAVYWYCAVLAELVFTSPEERALPAPVRAGTAFLFSTTYFAAAWQLMSAGQALTLGASLLALYVVARAPAGWSSRSSSWLTGFLGRNIHGFGICLAAGTVLFAPLLIANKYGPFTEGGGDVSIYADTTQYLTEHGLTLKGAPSRTLDHSLANLKGSVNTTVDRHVLNREAEKRYLTADRTLVNPPSTDNAVYRLLLLQSMSPYLYPPYGQFYFLATSTNYHIYYGVQAFVYGVLLASAWYVFRRRFPVPAALACTTLVAGSHALASVFYNMYSAQTISLLLSMLVLALLPSIRLFSRAGLRTYVIPTVYIWISYVHFLSLVLPLLFVAGLHSVRPWRGAAEPSTSSNKSKGSPSLRWVYWLVIGTFASLIGLLVLSGAQKSILFAQDLLVGLLSGRESNVYLGDRIEPFTLRWLSYLFGFVSQQHLQPFATEIAQVLRTINIGVALGVASFALGLAAVARMFCLPSWRQETRGDLHSILYGVLLFTIALHVYLSQGYVYTQAKGSQNILPLLYVALVMPFALGCAFRKRDRWLDLLTWALGASLLLFATTLLVPRAVYAYKIARTMDRSTILEPSFFAEAAKIRANDPNPFVLFEPRKSGDLYVSIQPFSGARLATTRHLSLTRLNLEARPPVGDKIDASQLIRPEDLPHLWTLSARKGESGAMDQWKAERVDSAKILAIYLFADDYEQNYGERSRRDGPGDKGMFSYVRNGSAMVYLPPGEAMSLEVTLAPRDLAAFDRMRDETALRLKKGEFANAEMNLAGTFITITHRFPRRAAPTMVPIARHGGEYWINVRVDGKELAMAGAAPGSQAAATVSAVMRKDPSGIISIEAAWAGIAEPQKEDWIGVFPVGGNDQSRLEFGFLGGRREGTRTFTLPAPKSNAEYEVRLFKPGSWNAVATGQVKPAGAPAR